MLSINIPVYNVEVNDLVRQVMQQAQLAGIDYEIRIYDDCSEEEIKKQNRHLAGYPGVVYKELPQNLGRAVIRNKMGLDSDKSYLLFIDADSRLDSETYIEMYVSNAFSGCVLCGGTKYDKAKPENTKKLLRWVYGRKREAIPAGKRNSQKGFIITSNNFLIDREVFQHIHFRKTIGPYGHEDTLLGYDLFSKNINPRHIDNPIVHIGLEDSDTFLAKTRKALDNLLYISEDILENANDFNERIRFLNRYFKLTKLVPRIVLSFFFILCKGVLERNLTGKRPLLLFYDLYKVGYFSTLKRSK